MRISKSRADLRSDRDTRSPSSGSTPRSTGENHPSSSLSVATGIGKSPALYAASNVPGSRSAPRATRSSSGSHVVGGGKAQGVGSGTMGTPRTLVDGFRDPRASHRRTRSRGGPTSVWEGDRTIWAWD